MASKYLKGGALNPAWCDEQDAEIRTERIMDSIMGLFDMDIDLSIQLGDGVDVSISNKPQMQNPMYIIDNAENDYEAKFNFIKNHSSTPEDLKLAREIIGLE